MSEPLTIRVHGTPAPQGSKRHVGNGRMIESSKNVKPWREAVKHAALQQDAKPLDGPLTVTVEFILRRPRSHHRTGKNAHLLRTGAPDRPSTRPDLDKLVRSTLDGLGDAGAWHDDAQVVTLMARKVYETAHEPPGAIITVERAGVWKP